MIIFKTANDITDYIITQKKGGKKVGFVPTMGALHTGHLSLINESVKENDLTVCSIFVNPAQFNNRDDFEHYPVTIEKDIESLVYTQCSVLFLPDESQIYPSGYQKKWYKLGKLETILEGHFRPGHFQGVCQAVDRLLEIVKPDNLYMGQKDFQQCKIVDRLLELTGRQKNLMLKIIPTHRAENGLAMSSRNLRLTEQQLQQAVGIYKTLVYMKENLAATSIGELKIKATKNLQKDGFTVDYVEIADGDTLEPADGQTQNLVALIAATIGHVRLIDNMLLN